MQIILLILQLLTLAALMVVLHQNRQIEKRIDSLRDDIAEFYSENTQFHRRYFGKGTYAVVREWFDTHDCTAEYVKAESLADAYMKSKTIDENKGTIINIFKVK